MKDIDFLGVEIVIDGEVKPGLINLGAVTLRKYKKECILDITYSEFVFENGQTTIRCTVKEDSEIFDSCPYDLEATDLIIGKLDVAEIFVGTEDNDKGIHYEPEHQTLFVKLGGMTKAIDLTLGD